MSATQKSVIHNPEIWKIAEIGDYRRQGDPSLNLA
jgi:hypothetical protein